MHFMYSPFRATAGSLFRRLSLLPEDTADGPVGHNTNNSALDLTTAPVINSSDTSSALVRGCFTGLGLVHFAVAFWTRAWVMRLVLLFGFLGLLGYAVAKLRLLERVRWLMGQSWDYLRTRVRTGRAKEAVIGEELQSAEEEEDLGDILVPGPFKSAWRWALQIERHVRKFFIVSIRLLPPSRVSLCA